MSHTDTDEEVPLTEMFNKLIAVCNICFFFINVSMCAINHKKIRVPHTRVAHCQTDEDLKLQIVVIHPNNDIQLTAE